MLDSGGQASLPSRIATLVHAHFDALPSRSKPSIFPDGSREWIPMTGIVVVVGMFCPFILHGSIDCVICTYALNRGEYTFGKSALHITHVCLMPWSNEYHNI